MSHPLQSRAVYAGSFDPITYGHLNLIRRASRLFDELVIGVGENPKKKYLFALKQRVDMVEEQVSDLTNVRVQPFHGLLISFAKEVHAQVIVRGLRAATDFEYEFQMGLINMEMEREIETLFLLSNPENIFISSSAVKEIAYFGGKLATYVPPAVADQLELAFQKERDSQTPSPESTKEST